MTPGRTETIILATRTREGLQRPDGETQVKIDYTQLAVRQPDSGDDRARPAGRRTRGESAGSTQSVLVTRRRTLRGTMVPKRQLPARQT